MDILYDKVLADVNFEAVLDNLATPLAELGVGAEVIGDVVQVAESIRGDVLCK